MVRDDKASLRKQWLQSFKQALEEDSWGQLVEAQEHYYRLGGLIVGKLSSIPNITPTDKDLLTRLGLCLSARCRALSTLNPSENQISVTDMKLLLPVFENIFENSNEKRININALKYQDATPCMPLSSGLVITSGDADTHQQSESVQNEIIRSQQDKSGTQVSIRIDKIGLKDAQVYINPKITVVVIDQLGVVMDTQDTSLAIEKRVNHVIFNQNIILNISHEIMQREGCAVIFEFKHFKPKKNKISTRCWSMLEMNEMKSDEELVLEIYHKPTDYKRKRLRLHSQKPLYMHVFVTFVKSISRSIL
eukprot:GHVR01065548.1.p1 GENE.GHVR01065548.1~~GHVR01065548.1.p1  ORF type:complete len:306 (+),score=65.08 GHVR01065548.1:43-960(+)